MNPQHPRPTSAKNSRFYGRQIDKILAEKKKVQLEVQAATAKEIAGRNQHLLRRLNEQQDQEALAEFTIQRRIDERTNALHAAQRELEDILEEYGPAAWTLLPPSLKAPEIFQHMPQTLAAVGSQSVKVEEADFVLQELLDDQWWALAELGCNKLQSDGGVGGSAALAAAQRLVEEIQEVSVCCARDEGIRHDQAQALPHLQRELLDAKRTVEDLTVRQSKWDGMYYSMLAASLTKIQELKLDWDDTDERAAARYAQEVRQNQRMSRESQDEHAKTLARRELLMECLQDLQNKMTSNPQHKGGAWWRLWSFLNKEVETSRKELERLRATTARTKLLNNNLSSTVAGLHRSCEALRTDIRSLSSCGSREQQRWAVWAGKVEARIVHAIAAVEVCTEGSCWNDPAALSRLRLQVDGLRNIELLCNPEKLVSDWEALLASVECELGMKQQMLADQHSDMEHYEEIEQTYDATSSSNCASHNEQYPEEQLLHEGGLDAEHEELQRPPSSLCYLESPD